MKLKRQVVFPFLRKGKRERERGVKKGNGGRGRGIGRGRERDRKRGKTRTHALDSQYKQEFSLFSSLSPLSSQPPNLRHPLPPPPRDSENALCYYPTLLNLLPCAQCWPRRYQWRHPRSWHRLTTCCPASSNVTSLHAALD